MTIQDMDISLNITTEPPAGANKKTGKSGKFSKISIASNKKQSLVRSKVGDKNTSKQTSVAQGRVVKRIKQKSLSAIVAKKLSQNNVVNKTKDVPKISQSTSKNTSNVSQAAEHKAPLESIKQNAVPKKLVSNDVNDKSNETTVAFTKVEAAHIGKTILAKKKKVNEAGPKKSLSDIYSNRDVAISKESTMLGSFSNVDEDRNNSSNKQHNVGQREKVSVKHGLKKLNKFNNDKRQRRNKDNVKGNIAKDTVKDTGNTYNRSSGKISSLFGNNPEVPNIGQRLVKPVNEIIFTGKNFADLDIHPHMVANLEQNMQITKMTTVQQKAIPQIFSGKDILIRSQTGSGKTLAYALPIVELLHKIRPKLTRNSGLNALVVVPTRELALQTYECFLKLVKSFTWIVPGYLVGGEKRKAEKARLRKGCNILVGTPGRLLDHIKHTTALKLNDIKYFVLDEADRMLDVGYEKDISEIVNALKNTDSQINESYDPMKIFKQNTKKIFTDEETTFEDQNNKDQENNKEHEKINKNNKKMSEVKESVNSDDESNDDDNEQDSDMETDNSSSDNNSLLNNSSVTMKKKVKNKKNINIIKQEEGAKIPHENNKQEDKKSSDANSSQRQTILLSATLTQAVERLAGLAMQNPIFVDAAKENLEKVNGNTNEVNEDLIVPQSVVQSYIVTPPKLRMVTLSAYIAGRCQDSRQHKILIFMATQDMVDYYTDILSSILTNPVNEDDEDSDPLVDVEFFKLHGNMNQKERTEVFKTFRSARSSVLLCTDVAARGLDLPKVDCVVQYTGPLSARDYVHRIGRTARAGSSGTATIFLTPPEIEFVRMLESRRIRIKQEDMNDVLDKLLGPLSIHRSVQAAAIALQNDFETLVLEDKNLRNKAYKAYVSWVRFYASYPRDMRDIFNRKELHLGHYAKSFALRDPPQRIGGIGKTLREKDSKPKHNNRLTNERNDVAPETRKKRTNENGDRNMGFLKRVKMLNVSEYDSGLEPIKKPRKV